MKLATALVELGRQLEQNGCRFALVGGIAASARGEARFTRDIDVVVASDGDSESEQVVFALGKQGYQIVASVEQEAAGRLATARMRNTAGIVCDLIFATTGIEREIVQDAELTEVFRKVFIPTATAEALLAMKTLSATSRRPRDGGDIAAIVLANPGFNEGLVQSYLATIEQRGYARGQNLAEKWQRLRSDLGI